MIFHIRNSKGQQFLNIFFPFCTLPYLLHNPASNESPVKIGIELVIMQILGFEDFLSFVIDFTKMIMIWIIICSTCVVNSQFLKFNKNKCKQRTFKNKIVFHFFLLKTALGWKKYFSMECSKICKMYKIYPLFGQLLFQLYLGTTEWIFFGRFSNKNSNCPYLDMVTCWNVQYAKLHTHLYFFP